MTEKQRAYLLKTYSEDHLNYMSGKEAWTLIDGIIRKAKKEQQSRFKQRSSYRNYDPDYEDWGYEEPYPGFEMDYCGGGR